ncbi:MAG: 1-deoxy-D-xylulose-5-phosphate reductoisomerase [Planctomycetota bacterium]
MQRKRIFLLGSSGSIGKQTLQVVRENPDLFEIVGLAVRRDVSTLREQAAEHRPAAICVSDAAAAHGLSTSLNCRSYVGEPALLEAIERHESDVVVNAITGAAGLRANVVALRTGRRLCIANKESLVMAGKLLLRLAGGDRSRILPIDSEHSGVYQCLLAGKVSEVRRIVLTASGGPFRGCDKATLEMASVTAALKHPTWRMGPKISVDSATLMNKALEIIEAAVLFDLAPDQIDVLVHPRSIVHAFVEFHDGSVLAHLGPTDMRLQIQYALTYPDRWPRKQPTLDLAQLRELKFEALDEEIFPSLRLARRACTIGETATTVLNAANEKAVELFLAERITLPRIFELVDQALAVHQPCPVESIEQVLSIDLKTRNLVAQWVS